MTSPSKAMMATGIATNKEMKRNTTMKMIITRTQMARTDEASSLRALRLLPFAVASHPSAGCAAAAETFQSTIDSRTSFII